MLLLQNVKLYDNIVDILCINGRIIKIGNVSYKLLKEMFSTEGIAVIDCKNQYAIPAYIDNHVHIVGGGGENGFSSRIGEINVADIVKHGIATVVGVLGTDTSTKTIENLVAKTKALNEEGITAYCLTGGYEFPSPTLTGRIQKDIVFINEIIGLKTAISDHRCYNPNFDELIKIISETRVASLIAKKPGIINIHVGYGKGNMDVLLDIIEKTNIPVRNIFPTHVTKTDIIIEQAIKMTNIGGYVDVTAGRNIEQTTQILNYMIMKGDATKITVSSDANGSCPIWENETFKGITIQDMSGIHKLVRELMIKYNYPLYEAIAFVTSNPANLLQLNTKGKLDNNYDADILLLNNDLEIEKVICKGKILKK